MKNKHSRAKVIEMLKKDLNKETDEWKKVRREITKIKRSKQKKTEHWDNLVIQDWLLVDRLYTYGSAIELLEEKEGE